MKIGVRFGVLAGAAIATTLGVFGTGPAQAIGGPDLTITVGSASGEVGDTVEVPMTVRSMGTEAASGGLEFEVQAPEGTSITGDVLDTCTVSADKKRATCEDSADWPVGTVQQSHLQLTIDSESAYTSIGSAFVTTEGDINPDNGRAEVRVTKPGSGIVPPISTGSSL